MFFAQATHVTSGIPAYSANALVPFGRVASSNLSDFSRPSILWGIDGVFDLNFIAADEAFATTDHCGRIRVLDDDLDPRYVYWNLKATRERYDFDRVFRASLCNVRAEVEVIAPIDSATGEFNLEAQRRMANRMEMLDKARSAAFATLGKLMRERLRVKDITI